MVVTEAPRVRERMRLVENAPAPMVVTESGMVTEVRSLS